MFAECASVFIPLQAILEVAPTVFQCIVALAGMAELVLVLDASINDAGAAFELVVRQAFRAHSSVVLQTSFLHLQA